MAGAKETPRQKMIGMMYLVLTALLALNISKEILDGFVKVDNSLLQTQSTLSSKIHDTYTALELKYNSNQEKVGPFFDEAQEITERSENLITYLNKLKSRCLSTSEGDYLEQEKLNFEKYYGLDEFGKDTTLNLSYIKRQDEFQALTYFMVGSDPLNPKTSKWSANALKVAIEEFRDSIVKTSVIDVDGYPISLPLSTVKSLKERFTLGDELEDGKMISWEEANFFDNPLCAVIPLMSKMIIDVQDAEEDVIGWLLSSTEAKSLKFSEVMPLTIPQSNYVLRGDTARANIFLAAFDPTKKTRSLR